MNADTFNPTNKKEAPVSLVHITARLARATLVATVALVTVGAYAQIGDNVSLARACFLAAVAALAAYITIRGTDTNPPDIAHARRSAQMWTVTCGALAGAYVALTLTDVFPQPLLSAVLLGAAVGFATRTVVLHRQATANGPVD